MKTRENETHASKHSRARIVVLAALANEQVDLHSFALCLVTLRLERMESLMRIISRRRKYREMKQMFSKAPMQLL